MSRDIRVHVEHDPLRRGVAVHVSLAPGQACSFTQPDSVTVEPDVQAEATPLYLADDTARALYAALAEHYGHNGHDTRALRRDYDAERARVDKMLDRLLDRP